MTVLAFPSYASAEESPVGVDAMSAPSSFLQQLAYCERVNLYVAGYQQRQGDLAESRIALRRWSKLLTADVWLNAENGKVNEDALLEYDKTGKRLLEVWIQKPELALDAANACESYVEDGWQRAEALGGQVDGKTMRQFEQMAHDAMTRRMDL